MQRLSRRAPALLDSRSTGVSLQAAAGKEGILVERTASFIGILRMALDQHVPCFRMHQTMEKLSFRIKAYADAGAYSHISHHLASPAGAVDRFPQSRPVHIRIKLDRNRKSPGKGSHKVHILPALLRCRFDVSVSMGVLLQVQRPEAGYSQGFDGILLKPGNDFRQHPGCGGGRKPHFRKNANGAILHFSHAANYFSTACFYTAD